MAKLYFRYAAMNAGKSTALLQAAHNYAERGMRVRLFTAAHDDRAGYGVIGSRLGLQRQVETFGAQTVFDAAWLGPGYACVLIDEAHRTTGGDLGNFLMAGLPNATYIGFTGTPVDKTVYGKGTFKTFGCEDDAGYLHKYSIADSIEDGTTLPLYYQLAPNEMLVPHETLDKEFLSLAEAIEEVASTNGAK